MEFGHDGHGCRALAHAQAHGWSERGDGEPEGVSGSGKGSLRRSVMAEQGRRGEDARGSKARQWWGALWCMATTKSFHRVRGVRCCARLGVRFWASSVPNWAMGLEAKFFIF